MDRRWEIECGCESVGVCGIMQRTVGGLDIPMECVTAGPLRDECLSVCVMETQRETEKERVTVSPPPIAFAERRAKSFNRSWSDPTPVKQDSLQDSKDSESHR